MLNLRRQSFEVFFPHLEVSGETVKSKANPIVPLFPGYMFVAFDAVVTERPEILAPAPPAEIVAALTS